MVKAATWLCGNRYGRNGGKNGTAGNVPPLPWTSLSSPFSAYCIDSYNKITLSSHEISGLHGQ